MSNSETLSPAQHLAAANQAHYPNESAEYRAYRNALLAEEIDLRRHMERVSAQRRRAQRAGAAPSAFPHIESCAGPFSGWTHDGVRRDGGRRPTADAGGSFHAVRPLRPRPPRVDLCSPLAARTNLGRVAPGAAIGKPISRRTPRRSCGCRASRRAGRGVRSGDGPRRCNRALTRAWVPRRKRSTQRWRCHRLLSARFRDCLARIQGAQKKVCARLVPHQCRWATTMFVRCMHATHKCLVSLRNPNARRKGDALGTAFAQSINKMCV